MGARTAWATLFGEGAVSAAGGGERTGGVGGEGRAGEGRGGAGDVVTGEERPGGRDDAQVWGRVGEADAPNGRSRDRRRRPLTVAPRALGVPPLRRRPRRLGNKAAAPAKVRTAGAFVGAHCPRNRPDPAPGRVGPVSTGMLRGAKAQRHAPPPRRRRLPEEPLRQ